MDYQPMVLDQLPTKRDILSHCIYVYKNRYKFHMTLDDVLLTTSKVAKYIWDHAEIPVIDFDMIIAALTQLVMVAVSECRGHRHDVVDLGVLREIVMDSNVFQRNRKV